MAASPNCAKSEAPVVLLGLGFTTRRLARRLLVRGCPVYAIVRNAERFRDLAAVGLRFTSVPAGAIVIHTVPPLPDEEAAELRSRITGLQPRRVIYISSTGVYGRHREVNERTPVDPSTEKGQARLSEELWIQAGWQSLIVRPAAIYGPGRGVHTRIGKGESARGTGIVSRIHVDDLAAVIEAGIFTDLEGAWPLADDHPCTSDEIFLFCRRLMRIKEDDSRRSSSIEGRSASIEGRKVNGTAIRRELEVSLTYSSYEAGILASLAEGRS